MRIDITKSGGTSISLYPLDEYLSYVLFDDLFLRRDIIPTKELSDKHDGSLTLVNYKPMATFSFENSPGYMPFIIEVRAQSEGDSTSIENPAGIEVSYGEKTIHLNLGNLSRVIKAYDFEIYKRTVYVSVIQGATVKDFIFDVIILAYSGGSYGGAIDTEFTNRWEFAEKKIKPLIQTLESAIPTIREGFRIEYKFYYSRYSDILLYPYIFLFPKGIVNEISDFLLSLYQQTYGIITKLPPEFTPNENVQSPELQKFLEKLPLDLIAEAVIGTYGSSPAILLPKGDYSQYLTGNERIINLENSDVIVFGNPRAQEQQTPAPQQ